MRPPTSSSSIRSISQPRTDVVTLLHNAAAERQVDTRTRRLRRTATRPHRHRFRHRSQRFVSTGREIRRRLRGAPAVRCSNSTTAPSDTVSTESNGNAACARIPSETEGPFPADSSNGPNVLNVSGVVRSDIRSSFGGLSGTADGVPLTIVLSIVAVSTCEVLAGRAVYLWHCDRLGRYSLYSSGAANQNYLRGVQEADAAGRVTFTSIFPGCYAGRWPHIHFEVYPSLAAAASVATKWRRRRLRCRSRRAIRCTPRRATRRA